MLMLYLITMACLFIYGIMFIGYDNEHFEGKKIESVFGLILISIVWPLFAIIICAAIPLFLLYLFYEYVKEFFDDRRGY